MAMLVALPNDVELMVEHCLPRACTDIGHTKYYTTGLLKTQAWIQAMQCATATATFTHGHAHGRTP